MQGKTIADVLIAYTDGVAADALKAEDYLAMFPEHREELTALLGLVTQLRRVLRRVSPAPAYRAALHDDLVAAARQKMRPALTIQESPRRLRGLIIGAAIGSTVSVAAGIIATALLRRGALQRSQEAPSP